VAPARPDHVAGTDRRANRVVEAHRLERRALSVSLLFVVGSVLVAVVPGVDPRWSAIHLFAVGGLLSAIAGTTQLLAVTWGTAPAPSRGLTALQRWAVGTGAVGITAGMALDAAALIIGGGVAVGVGLASVGMSLVAIRRAAATDRFAPSVDGYLVALGFGLAGVALGVLAGTGDHSPGARAAHLSVNLLGLVGIVIAATLPFFAATQLRTRMSPLATPARLRLTLAWLTVASMLTAWGAHSSPLAWRVGLLAWAVGLVGIVLLLPRPGRRQLDFAGPRSAQLAAGLAWWFATLIALMTVDPFALTGSRWLPVLLIGGYAQILLASIAYLVPVVRGGGHERLAAGFSTTGSWVAVVTLNAAALAAAADATTAALALLAVTVADTVTRSVRVLRSG